MRQLCASVLIAAISLPVIRADGKTPAGACREWPKPKTPDDRRGGERVRDGTQLIAKRTNQSAQFRGPTRGPQLMPSGRSNSRRGREAW
jgi:hypothetical protein